MVAALAGDSTMTRWRDTAPWVVARVLRVVVAPERFLLDDVLRVVGVFTMSPTYGQGQGSCQVS